MLYHPDGLYVWDTWYFANGDHLDCIHLQLRRPFSQRGERESGALGHARTDDLLHWRSLPTALYPGAPGQMDDMELWTGSVIENQGLFYLFYTARGSRENGTVNRIALATSRDGERWTRSAAPVLVPDSRWYANEDHPLALYGHGHPIVDCRDLCVVRDPEGHGFWGFYAARRHARTNAQTSVIALCHSDDLLHWTQYPPCFAPDCFGCIEVPDVFYLNGKWNMLCLTGNQYGQRGRTSDPLARRATIYATSDDIRGPYHLDPEHNVVLASLNDQGYSAKTVQWQGRRVMFYTQGERKAGCPHGSISRPVLLEADADHRLHARWHPALDSLYAPCSVGRPMDLSSGAWGSIASWSGDRRITGQSDADWAVLPYDARLEDGRLTCDITLGSARSAGLALRMPGPDIMAGGLVLLLDAQAQEVVFTALRDFPEIERRSWPIERGRAYRVDVIMTGFVFMIYLDGELVIQCYEPRARSGHAALFVEQGQAQFENLSAHTER